MHLSYQRRFPALGATDREVWFRDREWNALQDRASVPLVARARLEALMEHYCAHGPIDMNEKMFKFLGHYKARRLQVRLEEFKAKSVRLFGFSQRLAGGSKFFVTGIDVAKKQRKADRGLMDGAGDEAIRVSESIG